VSRVIAAYDLDEDHGRLWVNADLKRIPEIVFVANQPMDRAQTVTYVPEARLLEAIDENRRVEAENAKLRELVQDIYKVMWACAEQRCTHRHDGCFRVHGNHGDICVSERCWYEDRMSELGIEVD